MASTRTIITLPEADKHWLEAYSKVHKISVAEAIRQGIQTLKNSETEQTYRQLVMKTMGLWEKGDGLDYQEKIRSEWPS